MDYLIVNVQKQMAVELEKLKIPARYDVHRLLLEDFSRCKGQYYLDHAATTLYSDSQLRNIAAELQGTLFGNPHSRHTPSDTATQIIEGVRERILKYFNVTSEDYDVIFTAGATDAMRIVAHNFNWNGTPDVLGYEKELPSLINGNLKEQRLSENSQKKHAAFVYQQENHTSVLGIRESSSSFGAYVYPVTSEKLASVLNNVSPATGNSDADESVTNDKPKRNCLFAYSAQCNFSGAKAPLEWIEKVQKGDLSEILKEDAVNSGSILPGRKQDMKATDDQQWFVLLDAAGYVATCPLDLEKWKPDFVPISFYKIFGYPTGLGCLLVSQRASKTLCKNYFGGGTVLMTDSRGMTVVPRPILHDRFEDGTISFLNIIALRHGFDVIMKHTGGMENVQCHVYHLARYVHHSLRSFRHVNGKPVAELYVQNEKWRVDTHGSIVNFNILNSDGSYVGYSQVEKVASLYNIHLRTGCLCNPGACQKYLNITKEKLVHQFEAGHVCGDAHDLVDGCPTGSVRISFGYMSTYEDADQLLNMIISCFVDGTLKIDTTWISDEGLLSAVNENTATEQIAIVKTAQNAIESSAPEFKSRDSKIAEAVSAGNISVEVTASISEEVKWRDVSKNSEVLPQNCGNPGQIKLTDIILYPVKSCGSLSVERWKLGAEGLQFDRRWMVVSDSGVTLTQKRLPCMSLIIPNIDMKRNSLTLSYEGKGSVSIPLEIPQLPCEGEDISLCGGRVCGDRVQGLDCGPEVGKWLSQVLGKPNLKLLRQINTRRARRALKSEGSKVKGQSFEELSLANDSQYLVIHRPSVRKLLEDIRKNGNADLDENELLKRFRGNIILDGGEPYEEDSWTSITINNVVFQVQGGCIRCQMVCVVPDTGERTKEPMLTLAAVRGSPMMFGVHAKALASSDILQEGNDNSINIEDLVEVKS